MCEYPIIQIAIDAINMEDSVRSSTSDISDLLATIAEVGLLEPIAVTEDHRLVFGSRRLRACQQLGWTQIPACVVPKAQRFRMQEIENKARKDLTLEEKVTLGQRIEASLNLQRGRPRKQEENRAKNSAPSETKDEKKVAHGPPFSDEVKARDIAAEQVGLSLTQDCGGESLIDDTDDLQEKQEENRAKTVISTEARDTKNKAHGPYLNSGIQARDIAAEQVGLSTTNYRRAKHIVHNENPALIDAINTGTLSLRAAADLASLPPEEQAELDYTDPAHLKEKARAVRETSQAPKPSCPPQEIPRKSDIEKKVRHLIQGLDRRNLVAIVREVNKESERQFFRGLYRKRPETLQCLDHPDRALELVRDLPPLDSYAFLEAYLKQISRQKWFLAHSDDPLPGLLEAALPILHHRLEEEKTANEPEHPTASSPDNVIDFHTGAASG